MEEDKSLLEYIRSVKKPSPVVNAAEQQDEPLVSRTGWENILVGATPLLAGLVTGELGVGAEVAGDALLTKEKREFDRDNELLKSSLALKKAAAAKSANLNTANYAKIVGPDGKPVLKKLSEYQGEEVFEKPTAGSQFFLEEKKDLETHKASLKAKLDALEKNGEKDKIADTLRKERNTLPITKTTQETARAYDSLLAASSGENAISDVSMVFAFMKMLDPQSVVRESEQITARKATSVTDALSNIQAWFKEGRTLTPDQVRRFVSEGKKIYERQLKAQSRLDSFYKKEAEKRGLDSSTVMGAQFYSSPGDKPSQIPVNTQKMNANDSAIYNWASKNKSNPKSKQIIDALRKKYGN